MFQHTRIRQWSTNTDFGKIILKRFQSLGFIFSSIFKIVFLTFYRTMPTAEILKRLSSRIFSWSLTYRHILFLAAGREQCNNSTDCICCNPKDACPKHYNDCTQTHDCPGKNDKACCSKYFVWYIRVTRIFLNVREHDIV
jgi:hypothetical protein